jgi:hypothetical protein
MRVPSTTSLFLGLTIASTALLIGFNAAALFLVR